jgi:hypothetical protein
MIALLSTDENGLPSTLNTIQAQEKRRGVCIAGMALLVTLQVTEEKGNAVFRLVIEDLWHYYIPIILIILIINILCMIVPCLLACG